jgi:uncharacterized membrane protein YbhN (UPF0104 family)
VLSALIVLGTIVLIATHENNMHAVAAQLRHLPPSSLAAAFAFVLAQIACQGLRLWAVFPRRFAMGPGRVLHAFTLGEWLNMFVPARSGDAVKILLMHQPRAGSASLPAVTGAVLADKVVDVASVVVLCGAGGLLGVLWSGTSSRLLTAGICAGVALAVFVALRCCGERVRAKLWARLQGLREGFTALRDPGRGLTSLSFSLAAWAAEGCALWILCSALGAALAPTAILLALVVLNLGIGVPIAVANLGVYEVALAAGLGRAGVPLPTALAIAVSHHGIELLAVSFGVACVWLRTIATPVQQARR